MGKRKHGSYLKVYFKTHQNLLCTILTHHPHMYTFK